MKLKLILIYFLSFINLIFSQISIREEKDLELIRRETAVAEKIQSQLESILNNYYKRGTYIINVRPYLERIVVKEVKEKPKTKPREEIDLPGLPFTPPIETEPGGELERFVIDQWLFSDRFRIKYLEITILLDEKKFQPADEEFVKTVVSSRAGLDESRGDILEVRRLPFPPPKEELEKLQLSSVEKPEKDIVKELIPYLYFGGTILSILLFIIIILQIINLVKAKKEKVSVPYHHPSLRYPAVGEPTSPSLPERELDRLPGTKPSLGLPSGPIGIDRERKDIFYELRQLMVTTLVGNPVLASQIFKRWVEIDKDNGIYQISGFLKATDPRLLDLLAEHLGQDITSKVDFAMNQMVSMDKEGIIEIFKKFREEFQKEQALLKEKLLSGGTEGDIFHFLKQLTPEQIFHIIKDEPPSIIAIALAQLPPEISTTVIKNFPEEIQTKIPVEMGKLKKIPLSAYRDIADKLAKKALEIEKIKYVTTDGIEALVNLLEQASPEQEQEILGRIVEQDILLAEELRKVYITFDDLPLLPDKVLSEILRGIDRETIIKSLLDAPSNVKNKFFSCLPARTKIIVSDSVKTLEDSGEVPIEDTYKARKIITQRIRELAKTGKLDLKKFLT